ncbi:Com family DNA-binding transcriptional regulator [Thalassolituus oleivorans]|uniref:Com family DNA-binding transcriptional regulator n=1 Tax=Thalassolituus oleivorans TaxID=187493 RepID=UPI0023F14112|nr:Com family DNA-binding transcriptional regulator [Thalassolituus oleivorans]
MQELRCSKCRKLLAKVSAVKNIEIKCSRCKFINNLECPERQTGEDNHVETFGALARRKTKAG